MKNQVRLLLCALILLNSASHDAHAQAQTPILPSQVEDFATLLITTKTPEERSNLLASKKDLLTPDLRRSLIRQGNIHLMAGQYSSAKDIYTLATNIAEQIGDREGIAEALLDTGTVNYFQANYPAALEQYQQARQIFLEVRNDYEAAKALSGLALIYKEQRRDAEALATLRQTLAEFTELSDKEEMANALSSIGSIQYGKGNFTEAAENFRKSAELSSNVENVLRIADSLYMQGDYAQASRYYKQSLAMVNGQNAAGMIAALNGAANSEYYQGNYDEALEYYQQNLVIEKSQRDQLGIANALRGIGNVYRSRGDYPAALENYFAGLQILEELRNNTGGLLASIGLTRSLQNNNPAALEYYDKALKRFFADGNKIDTARVLSLIGNAHYAQGNLDLAIDSYQQALALRETMDDPSGQADLQIALGTVYLRKRDYSEALNSYNNALKLVAPTGNRSLIAGILTRLGDVSVQQNLFDEALSLGVRAANLAKDTGSQEILWYAQLLIGKAQLALGSTSQAHEAFAAAVSTVELLRSAPTLSDAELGRNSILPYQAAVDLFIAEGNVAEAFNYAERAKVQNLYEVFRRNNAKSIKGLTSKELSAERSIIGEAISLQLQLDRDRQSRTSTPARRVSLEEKLRATREAYAALRNQLFATHPHLKIERGELPPLKIDELRSLIADRQTALLDYVTTERDTYLFVLTLDDHGEPTSKRRNAEVSLKAYPLNLRYEQLTSLVNTLQASLLQQKADVGQNLQRLYDVLLRPAAEQIKGRSKLVVVPDGMLWKVPFAALQPNADRYVIDQQAVSYAPSLSALREFGKPRRAAPSVGLFAEANPILPAQLIERMKLSYKDIHFQSSTEQVNEMNALATAYPVSRRLTLTGASASEEALKRNSGRPSFLHLAAPALLDDASPMSSFIGLSAVASSDDGSLQTREILNMESPARLAILSRVSHLGNYSTAQICMTWSWFVAGTPAVVINSWEVQSLPTTIFMKEFHMGLQNPRLSKAAALQRSALLLRRSTEYSHPFYWSGFVLMGK